MIPTKTEVDVTGYLPGEDVQMTLDANSLAHLMDVLSNLYSNKALAVVREYSTNALDAHIEAGVNRPIEVSTPSDFKPFLTIKDYGIGMDAETIRNVYSRYGASTKRGTNTQNGMLGLGSKSALTYTTQFNVTGIKNGIKTYVVVSRSADGSGVMKIISQTQTVEPNGVEISIPVTNRYEIKKIAREFFQYWKPGTVLLDGEDPAVSDGLQIGRFYVRKNNNHDIVVMGNVAYPVPTEQRIFNDYYGRVSVVAYVDMGEVNFTPSRESLHMTNLTKTTLASLRKEFNDEVVEYVTEKVEQANSHEDALREYLKIKDSELGSYLHDITYKGEKIPTSFIFPWAYSLIDGRKVSSRWVNPETLLDGKAVIITGYDKENIHSTHRAKVKIKIENDINIIDDIVWVLWCDQVPGEKWISSATTFAWDDISKIKLNRKKSQAVVIEKFDAIDSRGYRITDQSPDTTKTITYLSPTEVASQDARDMAGRVIGFHKSLQLLLVNKNQWKKFLAQYPNAVHFDTKVKEIVDDYLNNLTQEEKLYLASSWKDRSMCAKLDYNKVDDPTIKMAIKNVTTDGLSEDTERRYEFMKKIAGHWGINFPNLAGTGQKLFKTYPLIDVYGYNSHLVTGIPLEHVYMYLNAVYQKNNTNP